MFRPCLARFCHVLGTLLDSHVSGNRPVRRQRRGRFAVAISSARSRMCAIFLSSLTRRALKAFPAGPAKQARPGYSPVSSRRYCLVHVPGVTKSLGRVPWLRAGRRPRIAARRAMPKVTPSSGHPFPRGANRPASSVRGPALHPSRSPGKLRFSRLADPIPKLWSEALVLFGPRLGPKFFGPKYWPGFWPYTLARAGKAVVPRSARSKPSHRRPATRRAYRERGPRACLITSAAG